MIILFSPLQRPQRQPQGRPMGSAKLFPSNDHGLFYTSNPTATLLDAWTCVPRPRGPSLSLCCIRMHSPGLGLCIHVSVSLPRADMITYFRGNSSQCPHQCPVSLGLVRATRGAAHSNQDHLRKLVCEGVADRGMQDA